MGLAGAAACGGACWARAGGVEFGASPTGAGAWPKAMLRFVPLIIDTYNVLHVEGVLPAHLAGLDVDGLARLIAASRFAADAVWLVCDGSSQRARRMGRVVIEPAGAGRSADDHIADWLASYSAPRRVTLVTSDRAVARRGRARGASCVSSEEFLAMLVADEPKAGARAKARRVAEADPRRAVPLSDREVAGWMRLFGISAELAAVEAADGGAARGSDAGVAAGSEATSTDGAARAAEGAPRTRRAARRTADPASGAPLLDDAAVTRFLEEFGPGRQRDGAREARRAGDPLSALDRGDDRGLLAALGALDAGALERLMREHEPKTMMEAKSGTRRAGARRKRR